MVASSLSTASMPNYNTSSIQRITTRKCSSSAKLCCEANDLKDRAFYVIKIMMGRHLSLFFLQFNPMRQRIADTLSG